jgi:hypothetical protein
MNNEPVAWMVQYKGKHDFTFYKPVSHDDAVVIPLYTHPVKELSGVEIIGMSGKYDFTYEVDIIDFVRACLRKAQE